MSLLKTNSEDTLEIELTTPPALHTILGISNQLWKAREDISGEHRRVLQEFAIRHNCQRHLMATDVPN